MRFVIFEKGSKSFGRVLVAFLFSICFLIPVTPLFAANTYFVATNGNDSNPGTIASPFLTIKRGTLAMTCGDVLNVRGGTYNGQFGGTYGSVPACNSFSSAITIQAYPGEIVITSFLNRGDQSIFQLATNSYPTHRNFYWILKDLIFDGTGIDFAIGGLLGDFVRLQNVEVRNSKGSGILPHGSGWEFLNVNSHNNGSGSGDHGMYLSGSNNLIDGGAFHDNTGYGIQIFDSGVISNNSNTVRNARIYNNSYGLVLASGVGNMAYNNLIYDNKFTGASISESGYCSRCALYNNTLYRNSGPAILVGAQGNSSVVQNNLVFGNSSTTFDLGVGSFFSNNLASDPLFTNATKRDLSLQPGSIAIHAGANLSSIFTTDFAGLPRPMAGFTIGAYDGGVPLSTSDSTPPTVSIVVTSGR